MPDQLDIARDLEAQGMQAREQAQYTDAQQFYVQALAIREQELRPDHPMIAFTLNTLGELLRHVRLSSTVLTHKRHSTAQRQVTPRLKPVFYTHLTSGLE